MGLSVLRRWLLVGAVALVGCFRFEAPDDSAAPGVDSDGDGWADDADCAPVDPRIHPEALERCDDRDDDCDGVGDAAIAPIRYVDDDGDGDGDPAAPRPMCEVRRGFSSNDGDCDDTNPVVHSGADERCNSIDDDCDGEVDEGAARGASTWYVDADGDGYGATAGAVSTCAPPVGYVGVLGDCDDARADVNPGRPEVCDAGDVDEDCDGLADDADDRQTGATGWYVDADRDGLGAVGAPVEWHCDPGAGWAAEAVDCDDADPSVGRLTWYGDADGDGFGAGVGVETCSTVDGAAREAGDCDDGDPSVHPGATEADCADGVDYNCDGGAGLVDGDGDGYPACEDCADDDASISPGAAERCDGLDDDCDGVVDPADAIDAAPWSPDLDGDGFGDPRGAVAACACPPGFVADATDCDDTTARVNPANAEVCDDGLDNDCSGVEDDPGALLCRPLHYDADGDGYPSREVDCLCRSAGVGSPFGGDCADADAGVHPEAVDVCGDGVDGDCDGDDGCDG